MAKRGGTHHQKRIAIAKEIPISDKKKYKWMIQTAPGPHPKKHSIPMVVVLREILGLAKTSDEAKRILTKRMVLIDGKVRKGLNFPLGIMDVISFPAIEKYYRIVLDSKGKLRPVPIHKNESEMKILKVIRKHVAPKGTLVVTFHDGKNLVADNNLSVGDSIAFSLKDFKLASLLKLENGCRCLIREGKHAGTVATLKQILKRDGRDDEAVVNTDKDEFITVAKYLFVVNDSYKGAS
ncbi:MAG: 30S ribosomal protein S4e [Candidatus Micrarchaeota archaeon]